MLPVVIWMVFFFAIPNLYMLFISFMQVGGYGGVVYHVTLSNYGLLFHWIEFKVIADSLLFALLVTLFCLGVGYPFAYIIATAPPRKKIVLLFLVIVPFWTSSLIRTFAMMFLIGTEGFINSVLLSLHLIHQPLDMLYTLGATYVGQFYSMLPYMILPLYASLQGIMDHPEYMEAARDLGAGARKTFWRVVAPLSIPGIATGSLLVFIPTLGTFFIPLLMGGGGVVLVGNFIENQFLAADNWPFGAAASALVIAITLLLIGFGSRYMNNAFLEEGK